MNIQIASTTRSPHVAAAVARAGSRPSRLCAGLLAGLGVAGFLLASAPALAQFAPDLRTAAPYAVLGPNSVTCTTSTINGNVGTQAASISNTGCTINGLTNLNLGAQVVTDLNTAKGEVDGQTCTTTQSGTLAGTTLGPGVHCFTAGAALTGLLTLNGPANGIWIFRIGTTGPANLTATDFTVQMSGGGQACNVFWRSSQDATVTRGGFLGTILSGRDLTVTGVGTYGGRALATRDLTITNVVPITGCPALAPASITVTKVSNGGVGAFGFTGDNGFGPQIITTAAPGVGVSGPPQTLTAAAVATTVTESVPPAGFTLASITCSGLGAGGTATPDIAARTVRLDAAATATGAAIACTFTNTLVLAAIPIPTLSEWAMIMLAGMMAIAGFAGLRRREGK